MTYRMQLGMVRNAGARVGTEQRRGGWYEFGELRLPVSLLSLGGGRTVNEWRLVEYVGEGHAIICNTWRTPLMSAPAFHYYAAPLLPPQWSREPSPGVLCVQLDTETGAISLPDSPAEIPAESPAEIPAEIRLVSFVNTLLASNEARVHSAADVVSDLAEFMEDTGLFVDMIAQFQDEDAQFEDEDGEA